MTLYREFRGQEPDKTAMLVGRGLVERAVEALQPNAAKLAAEKKAAEEQVTGGEADTKAEAAVIEVDNEWK